MEDTTERLDAKDVQAAARGRWREIHASVTGIDSALLDGKHHPCPKCGGADRFREIDADKGVLLCNKCFSENNGDGLSAAMHFRGLTFLAALQAVAAFCGVKGAKAITCADIVGEVAKRKAMPVEAFKAFGAKPAKRGKAQVAQCPVYDHRGQRCSSFDIGIGGGKLAKGLFPKGEKAGLFLPHDDGGEARLPEPGETWLLVEGVKDAAALFAMGYLVAGLPTCRMHRRFALLFAGVNVVVVSDLDTAGQDGGKVTAGRLVGIAESVRTARLPGEVTPSDGKDVRDILREELGAELVTRAIEAAAEWSGPSEGELPEVALPGGSTTITAASTRLGELMAGAGKFYSRGGVPVRLDQRDGQPILFALEARHLPSTFEIVARLMKVGTDPEGGEVFAPTVCGEQQAKLIAACDAFHAALPTITVVSPCPVLVERDGDIVAVTGYDRRSGVLARGEAPQEIPVEQAAAMLLGLLSDFRFATESDRARAVAALITPAMLLGGLLGGRAPIDMVEANESQAGKGYFHKLTAALYGCELRTVKQRSSGVGSMAEEFDTALLEGATMISFDNLRGKLDAPWLESFATEDSYYTRIPYKPPMQIDPRRVVVKGTSNKAELTPDLSNRCSGVRILKQEPGYQFREYAEGSVLHHVRANQARYLGAVFAIVRRWHTLGKPTLKVKEHDFREWAGALQYITEKLVGTAGLLDGHRDMQIRMATPTLSWLRAVAICVQRAGKLGDWLRPYQLLDIVTEHGVETPGVKVDADLADDAEFAKASRAIGRNLSAAIKGTTCAVDAFKVEKRTSPDKDGREKAEYAFFACSPNPPNASPNQNACSPNPPITSKVVSAREKIPVSANGYSSPALETSKPLGGLGVDWGNGSSVGETKESHPPKVLEIDLS